MAKRFALYSFGVLCLMVSALIGFNFAGQSAQAQAPASIVGFTVSGPNAWVIDQNGNVWEQKGSYYDHYGCGSHHSWVQYCEPPRFVGNFWTGDTGAVPTSPETWGTIKGKFDGEK